jgi:transglutaminase-like putative cysteine protease
MVEVAEEISSKCNSDEEIAKEIYLYVRNRIKYMKKLHINSTEETFRAGLGNCVEAAMLYIALQGIWAWRQDTNIHTTMRALG